MAKILMQYIEEQPAVWSHLLKNRKELFQPFADAFSGRDFRRILLIGSGSSYNASLIAAHLFEEFLGIETVVEVPTRLGAKISLLGNKDTLVLAVSQSGRSTSTLQIVDSLKNSGYTVVAVTADAESLLHRLAVRTC